MSDPQSALPGAKSRGIAQVAEAGLHGMITLRGDLTSDTLQSAAKAAAGLGIPKINAIQSGEGGSIAWMSPDELLILCPYEAVAARLDALSKALDGAHTLAVNVSDARSVFTVTGTRAREVMAKLTPVDVAPGAFGPGDFRRTRLAQVPAAFWMVADHTFKIVAFRSVAQYVFDLLTVAAQPGSEVNAWVEN